MPELGALTIFFLFISDLHGPVYVQDQVRRSSRAGKEMKETEQDKQKRNKKGKEQKESKEVTKQETAANFNKQDEPTDKNNYAKEKQEQEIREDEER
jgi:hypothetical protein